MNKKIYRKLIKTPHKIENAWRYTNPIHLVVNRNSWGGNLNRTARTALLEGFIAMRCDKSHFGKIPLTMAMKWHFDIEYISSPSGATKYDGGLYINRSSLSEFADINTIPF